MIPTESSCPSLKKISYNVLVPSLLQRSEISELKSFVSQNQCLVEEMAVFKIRVIIYVISKKCFQVAAIIGTKIAHGQIVDQDKRLVWTSLQLKSLSFPVLVGFYFVFYFFVWFSFFLDLFPSDTIGFSYLVDFAILLFFLSAIPRFFPFVIFLPDTICSLYIFLLTSYLGVFHCW